MNIIVILFPLALGLGLAGLGAFFWCMRTGQYADLDGAAWRVLQDDDAAKGGPRGAVSGSDGNALG
jgi:cbb3-type cytochrome oxidase maturation protein